MPTMETHIAQSLTKALIIGPSGAGKTGLLGSLANAGYKLFIWDYDNGLDILLDPKVVLPENRKNVRYKTFTDQVKAGVAPMALVQGINTFDAWIEDKENFGNIYSWGADTVAVLDSLTLFGNAAMRHVTSMNGRAGKAPQIQDWGEAMRIQEETVARLYSSSVKCNVIVMAHITFQDDTTNPGLQKAFPSALGNKLPPKIGEYFNSMLYVEKQAVGTSIVRKLKTQATYNMELKNPRPSLIPAEMEPDLAKFFQLMKVAA